VGGNAAIFEETRAGGVCVIALAGRIDTTNADELMARLTELFASGESALLLDLSRVRYLTSAAFRALLVAMHEAERKAARFALCNIVDSVRELFEMGGLLEAFTIYGSREEAVAKLA
jgi:anti-anti-sigma factor